jgi:hypothetical protein
VRVFVDARTDSVARADCPWKVPAAFAEGSVPDTCRSNHRADWDALLLARVESDSLAMIEDSLGMSVLRMPRSGAAAPPEDSARSR